MVRDPVACREWKSCNMDTILFRKHASRMLSVHCKRLLGMSNHGIADIRSVTSWGCAAYHVHPQPYNRFPGPGQHSPALCPISSHDEPSLLHTTICTTFDSLRYDPVWTMPNALRKHQKIAQSSSVSLSITLSRRFDLCTCCPPFRLVPRSNVLSRTLL
jgi:hypothetical protein